MRKKLMFFLLALLLVFPVKANAATLRAPKLNKYSAYMNKVVYLRWTKVKGAKSYEIQRAQINYNTGKVKKWKTWKKTKKLFVKKKATGDYKYRVRAIRGKKKGKWSKAKRIFAASGRITNSYYEKPEYIFGLYCEGRLYFRLLIKNKTLSQMGFVTAGHQGTVYALNKKTGKKVKSWPADLYIAEPNGYAKQINAKQEKSVYFYARMNEEEKEKYKDCKFMVTASFYPNPWVEPVSSQMAIACTNSIKDSAITGR